MMKMRSFCLMLLCGFAALAAAQSTTINLIFTATFNGIHEPIDSITIRNVSVGGDTVLYAPDTVLVLNDGVGTHDPEPLSSKGFVMYPPHPNPSRGEVTLSLFVPADEKVELHMADLTGRKRLLFDGMLPRGEHQFRVMPGSKGYYLLVAQTSHEIQVQKLLYLGAGNEDFKAVLMNTAARTSGGERSTGGFTWKSGDYLLMTGYFKNPGYIQIQENPTISTLYTLDLIIGLPCSGTPTLTDFDGNIYNTVQIGSQCWMKENLKVTHYKTGIPIPVVTNNYDWTMILTDAMCWYNNDSATYNGTYGALYNWYTIENKNICPVGWHVPTDPEWSEMIKRYDAGFDTDIQIFFGLEQRASVNLWQCFICH
jgi:hypothetical protein